MVEIFLRARDLLTNKNIVICTNYGGIYTSVEGLGEGLWERDQLCMKPRENRHNISIEIHQHGFKLVTLKNIYTFTSIFIIGICYESYLYISL